jgi:NADH-quinone oxidoreductase subunit J
MLDDVIQIVLMAVTIVLAISTVEIKDIIRALMSFCGMCISIGAIFWLLNAPYVAVFQILIYAGAVVTIFLAAIMLTRREESVR